MKKGTKHLLNAIFTPVLIYLMFSYIRLEVDSMEWSETDRAGVLLSSICFTIVGLILIEIVYLNKKE